MVDVVAEALPEVPPPAPDVSAPPRTVRTPSPKRTVMVEREVAATPDPAPTEAPAPEEAPAPAPTAEQSSEPGPAVPTASAPLAGAKPGPIGTALSGAGTGTGPAQLAAPISGAQRRAMMDRYLKELFRTRIRTRYPEEARELELSGNVVVQVTVDRGGRLVGARLNGSCPHALLCQDALQTVRAAAPFPPLPRDLGDSLQIDVPIKYQFQ
jgi:protein TonB